MLIRPADPADVDALVALVDSAYRGDASRAGWTTEADLLDGQRTDTDDVLAQLPHLLVAERDAEVIGCCALTPRDDHGYFGMFAVRPTTQGTGTGSQLLLAAEQVARDLGLARVVMTVLSARTELIAYYLRRGYVATGATEPFPYGQERFGLPRTGRPAVRRARQGPLSSRYRRTGCGSRFRGRAGALRPGEGQEASWRSSSCCTRERPRTWPR